MNERALATTRRQPVRRRKRNPSEGGFLVITAAAVLGGIALFGPKTPCEQANQKNDTKAACNCLDAPDDQLATIGCWIRTNPILAAGLGGAAILLFKIR